MHGLVIMVFAHICCAVLFCAVQCSPLARASLFCMEYHVTWNIQQTWCHWMSIIGRSPAHCIEYAHLIQWGRDRPDEEFDADIEEHMKWMYKHALARAQEFGIQANPACSSTAQCLCQHPMRICCLLPSNMCSNKDVQMDLCCCAAAAYQ